MPSQDVIYLYGKEPVHCSKCNRKLTALAIKIGGKLYGYYCALAMGWS